MNFEIDRRTGSRVARALPVRVKTATSGTEAAGETRDISTNGVFLYTKARAEEGSTVELVLILPSEFTGGKKCWVCCHARVLRVERGTGGGFGVAAAIERMDVLPEADV